MLQAGRILHVFFCDLALKKDEKNAFKEKTT